MKQVLFAVLLSGLVWPGTGQIYNREFLKGFVLIGLTFLFGLSLMMGAGAEILQRLPQGAGALNTEHIQRLMEEVREKRSGLLFSFNLLMTVTWVYAVVDAYLGARDRTKGDAPPAPPPPDKTS